MVVDTANEIVATGRRKTAVARVRMRPGTGEIKVNGRPFEQYFTVESWRLTILGPLRAVEQEGKWDIRVTLDGGGVPGQAGALRLGIARGLCQANAELRPGLKSGGFLTRDPRMKERKKYGQPGARKRFQFSKR